VLLFIVFNRNVDLIRFVEVVEVVEVGVRL